MIGKISTIQHLRLEILRRKTLAKKQEGDIKESISELKESLKPMNLVKNALTNRKIAVGIISTLAAFGISMTIRKKILSKTSGGFKEVLNKLLPMIASKLASSISESTFQQIRHSIMKKKDGTTEQQEQ
jgi:hypothetical protein